MKIFLDSADIAAIKPLCSTGLIDGITTNPSLLGKMGTNPVDVIKQLCIDLPTTLINVQVTEIEPEKAYKQAHNIAKIADNVIVKIPCISSLFQTIKKLSCEGIPINITLVFSLFQGVCMAKLGVTYISPFIGRLEEAEETNGSTTDLIAQLRKTFDFHGFSTKILAASIRNIEQCNTVILQGADAITIKPALFEQMIQHNLTTKGLEQFKDDWKSVAVPFF